MPLGAARFTLQGGLEGALQLISTQSVTAGENVLDFTNIHTPNEYKVHLLTYTNYKPTQDSVELGVRFFENGTLEDSTVYRFGYNYFDTGDANSLTESYSRLRAGYSTGNASQESASGHMYFYELRGSTTHSFQTMSHASITNGHVLRVVHGGGNLNQHSNVDGIRLQSIGGGNTMESLTASLYGLEV